MGITKDTPKYPCINEHPGFGEVVANMRGSDYTTIAVSTLVSMPFGYFAGTARLPQMRVPSMQMATIIGFCGGFALAYQQSGGRIMGRLVNDEEVKAMKRA